MTEVTKKQIIALSNIGWLKNDLNHIDILWVVDETPSSIESSLKLSTISKEQFNFLILADLTKLPHQGLFEIMFICECIRSKNPSAKIELFIPYLPYSRHDKTLSNKPFAIKPVLSFLQALRLKSICAMDVHNDELSRYLLPNLINISSVNYITEYIQALELNEPVIVAPDQGRAKYTMELSRLLSCNSIALEKIRTLGKVKLSPNKSGMSELTDRNVILVDDVIDTGDTILAAIGYLKRARACSINIVNSFSLNDAAIVLGSFDINSMTIFDAQSETGKLIISKMILEICKQT